MINQEDLSSSVPCMVTAKDIGSSEALANWLRERLPDLQLDLWGTAAGTKRVENLWNELLEGEILLEDSYPPKRTVHVASVHIKNEMGKTLVEAYQEMEDGSIRQRNRALSEKMLPGESVQDACLRGIFEELGCEMGARERVVILQDSYKKEEDERDSFSYPGLMTHYVIHKMVAYMQNLPSTEFSTEENESGRSITYEGALSCSKSFGGSQSASNPNVAARCVKRHIWRWI
ncbi:hypothetical protein O6H91_09G063700 [Diphasiastrum complanatum]|uniref:Uncharacterized protein n=2 Tax=Diphasiastrum complanatum TaxID=34168 RepID=A0ACC2CQ42_DIPCM|nr:hypothetical protein O6H91_09G063700 [Diphasiastrum complanatum]KAJ7544075.1 hypothetical protein O6H91_09G063700 [Diphasiastrum complanatum]